MSPSPEDILKLAQQIVDAKSTLAILQAKWDGYFQQVPNGGLIFDGVPAPRKGGRKPNSESVTGRVLALINSDPTAHYDAADIQRGLGIDKKQAERTLFRLYTTKKIGKHSRGNYEAIV